MPPADPDRAPRRAGRRAARLAACGALAALLATAGCAGSRAAPRPATSPALAPLEAELRAIIARYAADTVEVAVALVDLRSGDSLLIDAHVPMHAASTMKVPVMVQLFRLHDAGELSVDDSVTVRNEFRSIADGSTYALSVDDDSEGELYRAIGRRLPMRSLIEPMIVRSSNLATNILIATADPARIARTLAEFGAEDMRVLRGVEDTPAFERGMNNSTTAYAFMKVLAAIASGRAAAPESTQEMLEILGRQHFRSQIPAGLPDGVWVGNKTGWITRIDHDGAIVRPPGRPPYVLVVLARGFTDRAAAAATARDVSRRVYETLVVDG